MHNILESLPKFPFFSKIAELKDTSFLEREALTPKESRDLTLLPEEQYRFHFHAEKCMGCSSCVVACNEQNSNAPDIRWRKVAEVEWGDYPHTGRFFLSMACNHCLEPSCMKGCPTNSYTKDPLTGIVVHNQNSCIGCQYCTWNCPYSAPLYSPDLGIVTKCNMCHERLSQGDSPACVESCPVDAIEIEIINKEEWRRNKKNKNAPGLPDSSITESTTKITLPKNTDFESIQSIEKREVRQEHHHGSLISFLILSQLSVGVQILLNINQLISVLGYRSESAGAFISGNGSDVLTYSVIASAFLSMFIALFHLGRPLRAFRAVSGFFHSWISREIVFLSVFSFFAVIQAACTTNSIFPGFKSETWGIVFGSLASIFGIAGIFSSAKIYMVPARPIWNTSTTILRFFATTLMLGSAALLSLMHLYGIDDKAAVNFLLVLCINTALIQFGILLNLTSYDKRKRQIEVMEGIFILKKKYPGVFTARIFTLIAGGLILPALLEHLTAEKSFGNTSAGLIYSMFFLLLLSETAGRFLFFVTSIPKKMAGGFYS